MQTQMQLASRLGRVFSRFAPPRPQLIEAARLGEMDDVARLVREGADVDQQDCRGRTALHEAARNRHDELAAWLLAHEASHTICDTKGRTAFKQRGVKADFIHRVRQHYKRRSFDSEQWAPEVTAALTASRLNELTRCGFLKLPGFVSQESLLRLRRDFARFVEKIDENRGSGVAIKQNYFEEEHYWEEDAAYLTNNAFKHSAELASLACHETLTGLANAYMRGQASITRAVAMRYLPHAERDNDMFGWHHDLEDKRFKVMVLLTDLGPTDQTMSYVLGSHRLYHSYDRFLNNQCELGYCKSHLGDVKIRQTTGQAGDVFVFDSNGAHRGNRRPNANVRDVFFIEYDTELANIWGGDVAVCKANGREQQVPDPLTKLVATEKKWEHRVERKHPTWIENLHHIDRWR